MGMIFEWHMIWQSFDVATSYTVGCLLCFSHFHLEGERKGLMGHNGAQLAAGIPELAWFTMRLGYCSSLCQPGWGNVTPFPVVLGLLFKTGQWCSYKHHSMQHAALLQSQVMRRARWRTKRWGLKTDLHSYAAIGATDLMQKHSRWACGCTFGDIDFSFKTQINPATVIFSILSPPWFAHVNQVFTSTNIPGTFILYHFVIFWSFWHWQASLEYSVPPRIPLQSKAGSMPRSLRPAGELHWDPLKMTGFIIGWVWTD